MRSTDQATKEFYRSGPRWARAACWALVVLMLVTGATVCGVALLAGVGVHLGQIPAVPRGRLEVSAVWVVSALGLATLMAGLAGRWFIDALGRLSVVVDENGVHLTGTSGETVMLAFRRIREIRVRPHKAFDLWPPYRVVIETTGRRRGYHVFLGKGDPVEFAGRVADRAGLSAHRVEGQWEVFARSSP